jgi:diadenosine tetraphosphatase ApaH/serine/threonine PP2A family protein phosphatase
VARVAALYDVHGNLPALRAVLADVRAAGADEIVVGGDVLPGPMPAECIAALLAAGLPTAFIRGNGDRLTLEEGAGIDTGLPSTVRDALRWTADRLDDDHRTVIRSWPATARMTVEGVGDVLFCHATPRDDSEIFTRETADARLRPALEGVDARTVVCGHTHMQFDRTVGGIRVVNAGSVGIPYGGAEACWLLLGPGIELRRTWYDVDAAAERIRASGYPMAEQLIADHLLHPKSEREMLDVFARVEMGR